MLNAVTLSAGDLNVRVDESVQGHLLWDAMSQFRAAYVELTAIAHRLSSDNGGPSEKPCSPLAAQFDPPEHESLNMGQFATKALVAVDAMRETLGRAALFAAGEVNDDLIDATLLGPRVNGSFREVIVADRHRDPTTHIVGATTRIRLFMGEREPEYNRQPFVHIGTEDVPERLIGPRGEPILSVDVNDGDLYDNEGEGDTIDRLTREDIREILRIAGPQGWDEHLVDSIAAQVRTRRSAPVARIVRIVGPAEQPESEWQGDFAHYRWRTTLIFDWLKDEDDMPRSEDVVGATREECQANVDETIYKFVCAGNVKPGDWPGGV
jgi:hypothetical protein